MHKKALIPDLTIILDIPASVATERMNKDKKRTAIDGFEKEQFLEKVRENYLKLKELLGEEIIIINANSPIEIVYNQVKNSVLELLKE